MITIYLGNVGSGKTACYVRELALNRAKRPTFSNIVTNGIKNNIILSSDMIIRKIVEEPATKRSKKRVTYKLNTDFWKNVSKKYGGINIALDEAHTLMNARRSFSKINIVMNDFLALIRRILGSTESGAGELTLITQFPQRIDSIARMMATSVHYHVCHYRKVCNICGTYWAENSNTPEKVWTCPKCDSPAITKTNHVIEVWHFANMGCYEQWAYMHEKSYHKHYFVTDIETYFPMYSTLQWENLITEHLDDEE